MRLLFVSLLVVILCLSFHCHLAHSVDYQKLLEVNDQGAKDVNEGARIARGYGNYGHGGGHYGHGGGGGHYGHGGGGGRYGHGGHHYGR